MSDQIQRQFGENGAKPLTPGQTVLRRVQSITAGSAAVSVSGTCWDGSAVSAFTFDLPAGGQILGKFHSITAITGGNVWVTFP